VAYRLFAQQCYKFSVGEHTFHLTETLITSILALMAFYQGKDTPHLGSIAHHLLKQSLRCTHDDAVELLDGITYALALDSDGHIFGRDISRAKYLGLSDPHV